MLRGLAALALSPAAVSCPASSVSRRAAMVSALRVRTVEASDGETLIQLAGRRGLPGPWPRRLGREEQQTRSSGRSRLFLHLSIPVCLLSHFLFVVTRYRGLFFSFDLISLHSGSHAFGRRRLSLHTTPGGGQSRACLYASDCTRVFLGIFGLAPYLAFCPLSYSHPDQRTPLQVFLSAPLLLAFLSASAFPASSHPLGAFSFPHTSRSSPPPDLDGACMGPGIAGWAARSPPHAAAVGSTVFLPPCCRRCCWSAAPRCPAALALAMHAPCAGPLDPILSAFQDCFACRTCERGHSSLPLSSDFACRPACLRSRLSLAHSLGSCLRESVCGSCCSLCAFGSRATFALSALPCKRTSLFASSGFALGSPHRLQCLSPPRRRRPATAIAFTRHACTRVFHSAFRSLAPFLAFAHLSTTHTPRTRSPPPTGLPRDRFCSLLSPLLPFAVARIATPPTSTSPALPSLPPRKLALDPASA